MQGLWSTHRSRAAAKINLNSPLPSPATPDNAADPQAQTPPVQTPQAEDAPAEKKKEKDDPETGLLTSLAPTSTNKRKLRSRVDDPSSSSKRARTSDPVKDYLPPSTRLTALGGYESTIEHLLELVALPLLHPEIFSHTGVSPPRGVLLHGPPGCGKTLLANATAGELGVRFVNVSAPSLVSGMSGESERAVRDVFEEAKVSNHSSLIYASLFMDVTYTARGSMYSIYRRNRRDHAKARICSTRNGATNRRAVPHLHGWARFSLAFSYFQRSVNIPQSTSKPCRPSQRDCPSCNKPSRLA